MVIAFCRKPIAWSLMISAKVPCFNHPEEATLPLRWLCQLPLCGLAAEERLQAIIPRQQVNISPPDRTEKYRSFFVSSKGGSTQNASTTFGNPHRPAEQGQLCRCRSCLPSRREAVFRVRPEDEKLSLQERGGLHRGHAAHQCPTRIC